MKKRDLVRKVASETDLKQSEVEGVLNSLLDTIKEELVNEGEIRLLGFGRFFTKERAARTGRNPQDGSPVEIPSATVPKFTFAKDVKESVKKGS